MKSFKSTIVQVEGKGDPYATLAVSAYYIANLLSAIHAAPKNGDWWWEVQYELRDAHVTLGCPKLIDNDNREWEWSGPDLFHVVRYWNGSKWNNE